MTAIGCLDRPSHLAAAHFAAQNSTNTLIRFKVIAGPARPMGAYRLQDDSNATRVTFALDYTPTGLARIMDPLIARTMRMEVAMLSNLKPYLEDQAK
jgi:hypothetical protein